MNTLNVDYGQSNPYLANNENQFEKQFKTEATDTTLEEEMKKSAVQVSISMNAQIVLFTMNSSDLAKNNSTAQNDIFNFLSGQKVEGSYSLEDLGYTGKPISELSVGEAQELIEDDGFFGIEQTSNRVADFVFNFSGYDIALLEKGRAGIVQGFEEANKLWGGELPEISHQTQDATLALIDARIADLKAKEN